MPTSNAGWIAIAAALGTTLAPWGLAFTQSCSVDKKISVTDAGDAALALKPLDVRARCKLELETRAKARSLRAVPIDSDLEPGRERAAPRSRARRSDVAVVTTPTQTPGNAPL